MIVCNITIDHNQRKFQRNRSIHIERPDGISFDKHEGHITIIYKSIDSSIIHNVLVAFFQSKDTHVMSEA